MLIIRFIAFLGLYFFSGTSVLFADTCSIVSGTSKTISTDCTALEIEGDGSNVTVAENITISDTAIAVKTGNATNASITTNFVRLCKVCRNEQSWRTLPHRLQGQRAKHDRVPE